MYNDRLKIETIKLDQIECSILTQIVSYANGYNDTVNFDLAINNFDYVSKVKTIKALNFKKLVYVTQDMINKRECELTEKGKIAYEIIRTYPNDKVVEITIIEGKPMITLGKREAAVITTVGGLKKQFRNPIGTDELKARGITKETHAEAVINLRDRGLITFGTSLAWIRKVELTELGWKIYKNYIRN